MNKGQINPTRMELIKLKDKLKMAVRGHKLLKDKQDELIHSFIEIVNETRKLREEVDNLFSDALSVFLSMKQRKALVDIYEMLMVPSSQIDIAYKTNSIMTVEIPKIDINVSNKKQEQTYSDISAPMEIYEVENKMNALFPKLIKLAELEHSVNLMTEEIARTRRRVNVIDNVMIPDLQSDIKRITMKLEESERSNTVRIMKSKEIVMDKILSERAKRKDNE